MEGEKKEGAGGNRPVKIGLHSRTPVSRPSGEGGGR